MLRNAQVQATNFLNNPQDWMGVTVLAEENGADVWYIMTFHTVQITIRVAVSPGSFLKILPIVPRHFSVHSGTK